MGEMLVLCEQGEVSVTWDPEDIASVESAKSEWKRLKAEGYEFFEPVETKGKRITRFNKSLGKVIASPGVKAAADKTAGTRPKAMAGGPNDARP